MRLINARKLVIEDFTLRNKPKYAILSHTWGEGEVTFPDMAMKQHRHEMDGWSKIAKTCELAILDGYEYAWVDTCCIDKTSSAELGEAINSMFKWYQEAAVCYIYLSDLEDGSGYLEPLFKCRWWTRGWTLQELLASRDCIFFDFAWRRRGTKQQLSPMISYRTTLPKVVLENPTEILTYSVCSRMCWAANCQTTRPEDEAYCLLGLFGVNMPLIYGEGRRAFWRLQEEIIKSGIDLSIFLYSAPRVTYGFDKLFAGSPVHFKSYPDVKSHYDLNYYQHMSVVHRYLLLSLASPRIFLSCDTSGNEEREAQYLLSCEYYRLIDLYIPLVKIASGVFVRKGDIVEHASGVLKPLQSHTVIKILIDPTSTDLFYHQMRQRHSIMLTWPGRSASGLISAQPIDQFDHTENSFLNSDENFTATDIAAVTVKLDLAECELPNNGQIVVLFNLDKVSLFDQDRTLIIFWKGYNPELEEYMFSGHKNRQSLRWPKLRRIAGDFLDKQSDKIRHWNKKGKFCITASVHSDDSNSGPDGMLPRVQIDFSEQSDISN